MKTLLTLLIATLLLFILNLYRLQAGGDDVRTSEAFNEGGSSLQALAPNQQIPQIEHSNAKQFRIVWGKGQEAPFFISSGPDQNTGFCDVLAERLQVYLPEVRHQFLSEPLDHIRQRMDAKENVCYPCSLYTPDHAAQFGRLFSQPTHYYRPHGIIIRAEMESEITEKYGNPVDLTQLLASELRFGFPSQRRYGNLQPLLDQHRAQSENTVKFESESDASMLHLEMLSQNKLDATLDYVSGLHYFKRHSKKQLVFLPIKGYQDWLPGAVACPDNKFGQLAVLRINAVIDKIRQDQALQQNLQFWFDEGLPPYPVQTKE